MSKKRRDWSMHGRAKTDDFLNPFEAGKTALALGGGHSARSRLGDMWRWRCYFVGHRAVLPDLTENGKFVNARPRSPGTRGACAPRNDRRKQKPH